MIRTTLILAFASTFFSAHSATAALIAYEPFEYYEFGDDLLGRSGGFGFGGPWREGGFNASIHDNFDIAADNLGFGNLTRSGRAVWTTSVGAIAGVTRDLASPLGQTDSTVYLSFLGQASIPLHGGAFNGFLGLVLESPGEPELYIGKPGGGAIDRWSIEDRGGTRQHASNVPTQENVPAFLVVKAEFFASPNVNDKFTLYVNPRPGGPEPAAGIVKQDAAFGVVQGMTLYSSGAMGFDELRIGETFTDVTPVVPEPTSITLFGCGAIVVAAVAIGNQRRTRM